MEKLGIGYNKPFNVFNSIIEEPIDANLIYCADTEKALRILDVYWKEAMDAIDEEYSKEREKIIYLGRQL